MDFIAIIYFTACDFLRNVTQQFSDDAYDSYDYDTSASYDTNFTSY